jgi:hypothetical protein
VSSALVVGYVALSAFGAWQLFRLSWSDPETRIAGETSVKMVVVATITVALLILPFLALGLMELLVGAPVVRVGYAMTVVAVVAAIASWRAPRRVGSHGSSTLRATWPFAQLNPLARATVAASGLVFLLVGAMTICGYPRGFESWAYVLPTAVNWQQSGSLLPWDHAFPHAYPLNAQLYYGLLLSALPERFASGGGLPFLLMLALSVYGLGRTCGGTSTTAALVACGVMSVPLVSFSALELGTDVPGIALLAAATLILLARGALGLMTQCFLAGVAAGLAFGIKPLHLIGTGFLTLVAFGQGIEAVTVAPGRIAAGLVKMITFLLGFAAVAGYWLLRNLVIFGNPLYPVTLPMIGEFFGWRPAPDMAALDHTQFQFAWVRSSWEWAVYPWVEWHHIDMNFAGAGLGMFFAACVPVATAWFLARWVLGREPRSIATKTLWIGGSFVIVSWILLQDRQPRYAMAALVFLVPVVAWAIAQASGSARKIFEGVAGASIFVMLFALLSKELVVFGDRIVLARQFARSAWYEYPAEADSLPPNSTVMVLAPRVWHYPMAGASLANRVISMSEARRLLGFEYGLSMPEEPRIALDAQTLRAAGVTHVYTTAEELAPDGCLSLTEIARLERNPYNNVPLPSPRRLLKVSYCDAVDR